MNKVALILSSCLMATVLPAAYADTWLQVYAQNIGPIILQQGSVSIPTYSGGNRSLPSNFNTIQIGNSNFAGVWLSGGLNINTSSGTVCDGSGDCRFFKAGEQLSFVYNVQNEGYQCKFTATCNNGGPNCNWSINATSTGTQSPNLSCWTWNGDNAWQFGFNWTGSATSKK